ncbi:MerR family transcriptional regulator [Intrasporangium oryzae NRRL B-24470]|uniref:MerR family transcriptional regulator n=1 Tax=Intrasporangium oryzae NRRL B-24470 TaxID=1386089 RepID=W9G979_9MICO|nr:MerR family transcriptional regulator [Intrasporangium oryzae]EWT01807.1 MerR family transcriptional regulator [Intrasporangium oryzae NRRL B-24470]
MSTCEHDDEPFLTIGEVARDSGLSASALRFYDRQGVLVPAEVDPSSGYRRYTGAQVRSARLVAGLRRVGMPLGEVALVLEQDARGQVSGAAAVVAAHERRLEEGLADARWEIRRTLALLTGESVPGVVRVAVMAPALARAVRCVRFAVADPEGAPVVGAPGGADHVVLTGVLLEMGSSGLRLVATDRHRLAIGVAPVVEPSLAPQDPTGRVVPTAWLDAVVAASARDDIIEIVLHEASVEAFAGGARLQSACVPGTFPDYRPIVDPYLWSKPEATIDAGSAGATLHAGHHVDADGLAALVGAHSGRAVLGLRVQDGSVVLAQDSAAADVHVDPGFLHEALVAVDGPPALVLDGPVRPLAIRGADGGFSVLMPVAQP